MKRIMRLIKWIFRGINRVIRGSLRLVKRVLLSPFKVTLWSLVKTFRFAMRVRNKILNVVDKLESESQKWQRVFWLIKSPYKMMIGLGFSPAQATALLSASAVVTSGVAVNELVIEEISFENGSPGIYDAPSQQPIFYDEEAYNTLRLDLGVVSVGKVTISDITLGTAYAGSALPSGQTNVLMLGGRPTSTNPSFSETFLEAGTIKLDRLRCKQLKITNSEVHNLIIKSNASDGQSIAPSAGTPRDRGISGGNRADDMTTSGGYYDQLRVEAATSGVNGRVDELTLTNIWSKGGPCVVDRVKAGTLEVTFNEIGAGDGLAAKDFVVENNVKFKHFTNIENVEVLIAEPS